MSTSTKVTVAFQDGEGVHNTLAEIFSGDLSENACLFIAQGLLFSNAYVQAEIESYTVFKNSELLRTVPTQQERCSCAFCSESLKP